MTKASGWVLFDREKRARHVPRVWLSKVDALRTLEDLLRIYPAGHEWRARLVCCRIGDEPGPL